MNLQEIQQIMSKNMREKTTRLESTPINTKEIIYWKVKQKKRIPYTNVSAKDDIKWKKAATNF